MAIISGELGLVAAGTSIILNSNKWSASDNRDSEVFSLFSDYNATGVSVKSGTVVGGHNLSGTCEGILESTATAIITAGNTASSLCSEGLTFVLTLITGYTITFTGFFTSFDIDVEAGVVGKWRGTFESSGTAVTWA